MANCNEFLEAMIGAYKARVAPFNVNYRYVADELVYLIGNANADAVMYHARFAPTLAEALAKVPRQIRLIHVDDESGNEPLPGAVRYEELLASVSDEPLDVVPSPDDLYVLYTGGTTGMPKAVLWRQHDIYMNAMGGRTYGTGEPVTGLDEIVERSKPDGPGSMTAAPLMHGAAQWAAFINLCGGRPFVMAPTTTHFDPAELWAIASRERAVSLSIVGDAFGRPLVDELEAGDYDLSGLFVLVTGGAALSAPLKQRFVELLPHLTILDAGGSSESGSQMGQVSSSTQSASGRFAPNPGAVVVSEDLTRILSPGDDEIGWLAQQGPIPLGISRRSGEDRADISRHRRDPAFGSRRPRPVGRRRPNRAARQGFGDHQLRRREDLRRGGRGRNSRASRGVRRGGDRPAEHAVGQRGGGAGSAG